MTLLTDPLRARLADLLIEWRAREGSASWGEAADDLEATLRATPEAEEYASLDAARVIQLETAIQGVLDAYSDKGWAKSEMCRRLRAVLHATPDTARPVAPEGKVCGAPAPDRSGRSCDKPAGHDGDHWTYGGNTKTWAAVLATHREPR